MVIIKLKDIYTYSELTILSLNIFHLALSIFGDKRRKEFILVAVKILRVAARSEGVKSR